MSALRHLSTLLTRRERWASAALVVLALLGALAEALGIGAVFPLLNLLTHGEAMLQDARMQAVFDWTQAGSYERFVLIATAALMLLFVLKNGFLGTMYYAQSRFVCKVESRIGTELLAAYLCAPYVERVEHNSADRIRVITGEVSRVTAGFLLPLVTIVAESLVVIALVLLLLAIQLEAAVLALALIGFVAAAVQVGFRKRLNDRREMRVAASSAMFRAVSEGLGALKETKVLGQEQHFVRRFLASSGRYAAATITFLTVNLLPRLIIETAAVAALAGAIAITIVASQPLDSIVPVLTVFGLAAVRIMPSVTRVLGAANNLRYYAPSVREVASHVRASRELPREAVAHSGERLRIQTLELQGVSYRYPAASGSTLRDIDLRINRGEIVALTGRTGSGKSTLADIVLGLLAPADGTICVNGRAVTHLRRELGTFAGLVPQNFFILDDTVRRNVAFGISDDEIEDDRVWKALDLARLAMRVRSDHRQLEMPAGENGALLSGGERQRLSIARALYHDPDLLVFDEATSALDSETEAEVVSTIENLAGTKAVLVITHRAALLRCSTRVFFLDNGTLTLVRNPDELLILRQV